MCIVRYEASSPGSQTGHLFFEDTVPSDLSLKARYRFAAFCSLHLKAFEDNVIKDSGANMPISKSTLAKMGLWPCNEQSFLSAIAELGEPAAEVAESGTPGILVLRRNLCMTERDTTAIRRISGVLNTFQCHSLQPMYWPQRHWLLFAAIAPGAPRDLRHRLIHTLTFKV